MASTNSTTHYELSQYIGTDKPTYLVDYNQDMSKIDAGIYAAKSEADTNSGSIGNLSNLTTTVKTSLVAAVNEVDAETAGIGTLSNLTTTAKTDLVSAINEIDAEAAKIGTLTDLTTTAKTSLVAAINEVDGDVGNLSSLTTTAKTSSVAAINELDENIGTLSNLTTTAKSNLVAAVNEVNTPVDIITGGTEIRTNSKVDGKWVYCKRFNLSSLVPGTQIAHGLTNFTLIKWEAYTLYQGVYRELNYTTPSVYYIVDIGSTYIEYESNTTLEGGTGEVTIYYTKNS